MSFLNDNQLASMRATLNQSLPDTATIRRSTPSNVGGVEKDSWADLETGVACRISPIGGGEAGEVGGRISAETTHVITFAAKQDIEEADQVVSGGITYEVTQVRKRGTYELSRRVEVVEAVPS